MIITITMIIINPYHHPSPPASELPPSPPSSPPPSAYNHHHHHDVIHHAHQQSAAAPPQASRQAYLHNNHHWTITITVVITTMSTTTTLTINWSTIRSPYDRHDFILINKGRKDTKGQQLLSLFRNWYLKQFETKMLSSNLPKSEAISGFARSTALARPGFVAISRIFKAQTWLLGTWKVRGDWLDLYCFALATGLRLWLLS